MRNDSGKHPGEAAKAAGSGADPAVLAAASILRQDMETPPRLLDLARRVGLSHPRLNRGFRQCFGTTAFGYLRILRLEEARRLLTEGKASVTDAAYSVGYQSLPSFSRALQRVYEHRPLQPLHRRRRPAKTPRARNGSGKAPG